MDHSDISTSMKNLTIVYSELGRLQYSIDLDKIGYALSKRVLSECHPEIITGIVSLTNRYSDLNMNEAALQLIKEIVSHVVCGWS